MILVLFGACVGFLVGRYVVLTPKETDKIREQVRGEYALYYKQRHEAIASMSKSTCFTPSAEKVEAVTNWPTGSTGGTGMDTQTVVTTAEVPETIVEPTTKKKGGRSKNLGEVK